MSMDTCRHALVLRDDPVDGAVDLSVVEGVFDRNRGGAAKLDEPDTAFRLLALIGDVPVGDVAINGIARRMAGGKKAVLYGRVANLERREKRIKLRHVFSWRAPHDLRFGRACRAASLGTRLPNIGNPECRPSPRRQQWRSKGAS